MDTDSVANYRLHWTFTCGNDAQNGNHFFATIVKKSASHGYQRNPLPLLMPAKNRTTVGLSFRRRNRLATTALLGLAPVRFARASAATTGKHQRFRA